jgi:hypothetical protein
MEQHQFGDKLLIAPRLEPRAKLALTIVPHLGAFRQEEEAQVRVNFGQDIGP